MSSDKSWPDENWHYPSCPRHDDPAGSCSCAALESQLYDVKPPVSSAADLIRQAKEQGLIVAKQDYQS